VSSEKTHVRGYPRSLILVANQRAYNLLLVMNPNFGLILHRFGGQSPVTLNNASD